MKLDGEKLLADLSIFALFGYNEDCDYERLTNWMTEGEALNRQESWHQESRCTYVFKRVSHKQGDYTIEDRGVT